MQRSLPPLPPPSLQLLPLPQLPLVAVRRNKYCVRRVRIHLLHFITNEQKLG
jgi:hypothetical protein